MKKNLLALSMITAAGLFADNGSCESDCCSPSCCEPCCVPQPKKCIDCECYTPQYYDLQCAWGFFVDVEFLYWYARETNTAIASTILAQADGGTDQGGVFQNNFDGYISKIHTMGTSWDPGVRVGIGWNSCCDGWDLYLNWTYFKNSKTTTIHDDGSFWGLSGAGTSAITNPWSSVVIPGVFLRNLKGHWKTRFNQIDLEIGRKYWLSPCFTLRPFAGLRGAWTKTPFSLTATNGPIIFQELLQNIRTTKNKDQFHNRHWGVGILGGIQPNWFFCSNFILYADLDFALIWGEHKTTKKQRYLDQLTSNALVTQTITNTSSKAQFSSFEMSALFDAGIGLRWEETWCCDRYRTALDIGWEHHIWLDHSFRYKTMVGLGFNFQSLSDQLNFLSEGKFIEEISNLGYGGFVLRVRFDF